MAAAVAPTSRQVGLTLGVAVLGAVAGGGLGGEIGRGFAHATRPGWSIVAVLGLAVAALGYLTTTGWARDTAQRLAEPDGGGRETPAPRGIRLRYAGLTAAAGSGMGKSRTKRSTAALSPSIISFPERCASASGRPFQSTASSVPGSVSIVASA